MIASGGLTFDDDDINTNNSSEEEVWKKVKSPECSDTSTDSGENIHTLPINNTQEYVCLVNKKKMVMNEIKQNVVVKNNSDSEREMEISKELDKYDHKYGCWYGVTPPREIRRNKQKEKCIKFCNSLSVKKNEKKSSGDKEMTQMTNNHFGWQKKREVQRKLKLRDGRSSDENMDLLNPYDIPRSSKLVRVNSAKSLKSITQQKAIPCSFKYDDLSSITPSVATKAIEINKRKETKPSRVHFYKTFSLLVKLGGRSQTHKSFEQRNDNFVGAEDHQVEFQELLWLELQAWQHSHTIEEHDNILEEARKNVDAVLEEVIQYKFDECSATKSSVTNVINTSSAEESDECENEFLSFNCGMKASTPVQEKAEISPTTKLQTIPDVSENSFSCDKSFVGMEFSFDEPLLEKNSCENLLPVGSDIPDEILTDRKSKQIFAMNSIMDLLKKVDNVERLYPSMKALMEAHSRYKSVRFMRNMEAMIFWLGINKDMFHKLYLLAEFVDVDPDDIVTWKDWFDHGLDSLCLKTKQSYQFQHWISTSDLLESSGNLSSLSTNYAMRRSKREKRNRISINRLSLMEKTSTSRYRSFVEKGIREGGLLGLMKRAKDILSTTLSNARSALSDHYGQLSSSKISRKFLANDDELHMKNIIDFFKNSSGIRDFVAIPKWKPASAINSSLAKAWQDMCLPSFLHNYLFLLKFPFDIVHECIRFRLDYQLKVEPSLHSIRQLIQECKEVVSGGVLGRGFYIDMLSAVLSNDDKEILETIEKSIEEYDNDLKAMLNLYFEYLQSWFQMLQTVQHHGCETLKNIMEDEWTYSKAICPYVQGAEAKAGYKFCVLVSGLLKSTGQYLETSVDECFSMHNPHEDTTYLRQKMQSACRQYKVIFKEVRGRAIKALGFAKMLQKDLGIAASYSLTVSFEIILKQMKASGHVLLEYNFSQYFILIPPILSKMKKECLHLIGLSCGYENTAENSFSVGHYIVLLRKPNNRVMWLGRRVNFGMVPEISLALSYVDTNDDLLLICKNSYHLNTKRKELEEMFVNSISIKKEQTSSHGIIDNSLHEMKESSKRLSTIIATAIQHVNENLNVCAATEMDEADRNSTLKSCIETMHFCFSVGFEYLREMMRLFLGQKKTDLGPFFLEFSHIWMDFVMTRTEPGYGTRPRWAAQGMEFLVTAIDPVNLEHLLEDEFVDLKSKLNDCISHIVGRAEPRHKKKLRSSRSASPFAVHRSRSVPSSVYNKTEQQDVAETSDSVNRSSTMPTDIVSLKSQSLKVLNIENTSPAASDNDTLDSVSATMDDDDDGMDDTGGSDIPIIRVRSALQEIDERRTAKLQHMRVIGMVTNKKANFASQIVHMNVRKVNFKWQLGNKIGEGQFGKVYSAINLDTGELMAVKQIRFNPHDYGTIQEIADEITNIQAVQHDSLVKYFGVEVHKDEMLIFMENCSDGTIAEVSKLGLPESMIRVYTYQITKAINFLHQNGVVHRDIKGANIFLSSSGLIKIGDFGSAVKLKDPLCTTVGEVFNVRGTAAYMAPEVITMDKGKGYGRAADIWSLGCVVIEMGTGKQPWSEYDNIYAIMYKVGDGQCPVIPETLSEEGKDFLKLCFIHDQNERWTAHMLEDHPFVKCC